MFTKYWTFPWRRFWLWSFLWHYPLHLKVNKMHIMLPRILILLINDLRETRRNLVFGLDLKIIVVIQLTLMCWILKFKNSPASIHSPKYNIIPVPWIVTVVYHLVIRGLIIQINTILVPITSVSRNRTSLPYVKKSLSYLISHTSTHWTSWVRTLCISMITPRSIRN